MLKFDDIPNTVDQQNLGGAPNAADERFHSPGRDVDQSVDFISWPAHEGIRKVIVRISTRELSALAGVPFGVNCAEINAALKNFRRYLEQRANERLTGDANEVTLDVGSLT